MMAAVPYNEALARLTTSGTPLLRDSGLSREMLLAQFHPDQAADACTTLQIGVNAGDRCHPTLAALLQSNALIDGFDLAGAEQLVTDVLVIGVFVDEFHRAWPWSERRWHFVGSRMAELTPQRWHGGAAAIGAALGGARRVRSVDEPHLAPWLPRWAECEAAPALFPSVDRRCDAFSQWWTRASRGLDSAADLLAVNEVPAW